MDMAPGQWEGRGPNRKQNRTETQPSNCARGGVFSELGLAHLGHELTYLDLPTYPALPCPCVPTSYLSHFASINTRDTPHILSRRPQRSPLSSSGRWRAPVALPPAPTHLAIRSRSPRKPSISLVRAATFSKTSIRYRYRPCCQSSLHRPGGCQRPRTPTAAASDVRRSRRQMPFPNVRR
ncbi:hypothetical protein LY78DRAFT_483631 [Colletotrichum sublineola]|nr:hypothetical protein LY78DRAFT_483631 [Colletotrichum sublineola]